jgi:hypothetical protein
MRRGADAGNIARPYHGAGAGDDEDDLLCQDAQIAGRAYSGRGATELIHIGQAVINLKGTVDYFIENTFNYPTLAEAYKIAALDAWNRMK